MDEHRKLLLLKKKVLLLKKKELLRKKNWWVRPVWEDRKTEIEFHTAMRKLRESWDNSYFHKYFRIGPEVFDMLHKLVEDDLRKAHLCREPISSAERHAFTLRYLSSGLDVKDVAMAFRVGLETAREAIHLTCNVLWERLRVLYMKPPGPAEWADIARGFDERWQFPNCLGAVDGKHVRIVAPKKPGSQYYN
ncbi:uncharacterized protein LOC135371631 [Ornithodoros turicata]|uniref:uncharacterized protein LOC135371631 n=1 Tax=Ornithodoros turicata TaxID=34597 RepID=UPI003138EA63